MRASQRECEGGKHERVGGRGREREGEKEKKERKRESLTHTNVRMKRDAHTHTHKHTQTHALQVWSSPASGMREETLKRCLSAGVCLRFRGLGLGFLGFRCEKRHLNTHARLSARMRARLPEQECQERR
jgi:hypothetical protein